MKKALYTLFFVFSVVVTTAQENTSAKKINWISLEEAQELNAKEPRKIIIDLYTSWCGWCKRMDASTFSHPAIVEYINEKYYAVKLNAETRDTIVFNGTAYVNRSAANNRRPTHEIASIGSNNGRLGYPTVVYLDEKLNRISVVPGYKTAQDIEPIITYFGEDVYKSTSWEDYLAQFKSSIVTPAVQRGG
jgi:thioredoxin-related protein